MAYDDILHTVDSYYSQKVKTFGADHRGVDWNSLESQYVRFEQLLKLHNHPGKFSLNDYGCGYGALATYIRERGFQFTYRGFDISEAMIQKATEIFGNSPDCAIFSDPDQLEVADYSVASGIFNVKMDFEPERWKAYILDTLQTLAAKSRVGFAFNMLTSYSDADRMRLDLFYGDPLFFFDYCKRTFSRHVALLHDYGLYEFTMIVRLQ